MSEQGKIRTSKQIETDKVNIAATVDLDTYFRIKFAAERGGYKNMSNYIASMFKEHFLQEEIPHNK